jgi:hypothetical protein
VACSTTSASCFEKRSRRRADPADQRGPHGGDPFAASAAALGTGLIFLLTALARGAGRALGWPVWLGFGVLGVVLAVLGGILLAGALGRARHIHALPPQTIDSVKENVAWIKERTRSGGA